MVDKPTADATKASADKPKNAKRNRKHIKMLSAFAVLFGIIAMMACLTWIIPSGKYNLISDPNNPSETIREAGTYQEIPKIETVLNDETGETSTIDHRQGLWDIFMAPIKGMSDRLDVIVFVLILGGFLGVVMKTGALDAALGGLLKKMNGKEKWLIPILMTLFAIGGTTYGMQEEAVAFYALIVPVMIAAGYNAMTAVLIIVLGGGVGVLASTVNPFSTGIAARTANVQLGSILWIQALVLIAMLIIAIIFTMRYAAKVKAGKYKEDSSLASTFKALDLEAVPEYTKKRKAIMGIFALTFIIMIISLIPWTNFHITIFEDFHTWLASIPLFSAIIGAEHNVALGSWYFNEISALFLISALIIAFIYRKDFHGKNSSITDIFIDGAEQLLSVAVIIAVAAAVSIVMRNGGIEDTIIHWGETGLKNSNGGVVGILAYLFYLPLSFIIPSSSGLAAASMPIIAPVADLVGSTKETMVVAFATANGLLNMIAPTIASLMAGLTLAGVSYKTWVKRVLPVMFIFVVISLVAVFVMGVI
jgi:hypothetical membrane protein